jgi:SNF family Na+-dependent transporter
VTTAQFGLLGTVVGVVWFLLIVLAALWAHRAESHPA